MLALNEAVTHEDWLWAMLCAVYCEDFWRLDGIFRLVGRRVLKRAGIDAQSEHVPSGRGSTGRLNAFFDQLKCRFLGPQTELETDTAFVDEMHQKAHEIMAKADARDLAFWGLWRVPRSGWMRVIPDLRDKSGESVAQHSFKTAVYAGCLCPEAFAEAFLMGLVHDHAELIVGDLTPAEVQDRSQKQALECEAYRKMLSESGLPDKAAERLWLAFEACMTDKMPVAQWLHGADKLDMALQALTYERRFHVDLREFLDSSEKVWMAHTL